MHQSASYCGTSLPPEFISVGRTVRILFSSDATVTRPGFRLEYKLARWVSRVTCHVSRVLTVTTRSCDRVYDASHGRLLSPRWPSSVPRDTDCRFSVSAPDPAATVSVYFRYFRVSTSANCSDNYLEVRDGPGQDTSPLLARVRSRDV